jgi:hypothetical protein
MKRLIFIPLLFISLILSATKHYVAVGGGGAGTLVSPFATIAQVNAHSFAAGDSILFNRGDVWRETLTVPSSGSAGSPIVFSAYGTGSDPIIDGSALLTSWTSEVIGSGTGVKEQQTTANQTVTVFKYPSRTYAATQFTASSTYDLSQIEVNLSKVASPTMNITCYLYSDNSYNPTTLLATSSTTLAASTITNAAYHAFTFDQSFEVQSGTAYWIVLKGSAVNETNHVSWNSMSSGGDVMGDEDGTGAWASIIAWHGSYKVTGVADQYTAYYATSTVPNAVYEDGTVMVKKQAKTALGVNCYFWDSGNNRIYVRTSGDDDPTSTYDISACKRDYGVHSNDKDYLNIENLTIRYTNRAAIFVVTASTNVNITGCALYGNGFGIGFNGNTGIISYCSISEGHMIVDDLTFDNDYGAVGVNIEGTNLEIKYCVFENLYAPSVDYGEDGGGIEIYQYDLSLMENISIHHNKFTNTSGFLESAGRNNGGAVEHVHCYYNVFIETRAPDNWFSTHNGSTVAIDDFQAYNNIYISTGSSSAYLLWFATNPGAGDFIMKNNIIYVSNITSVTQQTLQLADHQYNIYFNPGNGAWTPGYTLGTGELNEDPHLYSELIPRLTSTSPAINAGTNVSLTTDYVGHRIYDGLPDMGAYEFGTWILTRLGVIIKDSNGIPITITQ